MERTAGVHSVGTRERKSESHRMEEGRKIRARSFRQKTKYKRGA